jgi:ParB family chromosome partitioning protein
MNDLPLRMVAFSKLAAPDAINARAKSNEGIDELCASILAQAAKVPSENPGDGLIQPLAVRPGDNGKLEIKDGRRRFHALRKLVKDGHMKKSDVVPVIVRNETDSEALETSLMANMVRLPMHPVDQHVVFAKLADQGNSQAEIAAHFGISERTVKQHLALGRLAPKIRDAWKNENISADVAKAFARHENQEVQASLYESLTKQFGKRFGVHQVVHELSGRRITLADCPEFKLVGADAYTAAGGKISEDLFDDKKYVDDVALLQKLAREKIEAMCADLVADGWKYALDSHDIPASSDFPAWPNVKDDDENEQLFEYGGEYQPEIWTAEEKARSGCVVELTANGSLKIYPGVIHPDSVHAGEPETDENVDDETGDDADDDSDESEDELTAVVTDDGVDDGKISAALMRTLSEALTVATTAALERQPDVAVRAAIAALMSQGGGGLQPVKLTTNGWPGNARPPKRAKFNEEFAKLETVALDEQYIRLGILVADALDLRSYNGAGPNAHDRILIAALDGNTFTSEARKAFSATDYFARAGKEIVLAAIEEMREGGGGEGLAPEDVLAEMKKSDLAVAAADQAQACGWLPLELRHPSYSLAISAAE